MKIYSNEALMEILRLHKLWLNNKDEGVRADLSSADLSSANLRFADLRFADLRFADLSSANLRSANLRSADLSSADLSSANLRFANLRSADLSSANLRFADLRFADLRFADLRFADLSSANLRSADLSSADLSSANLRFAIGEMRFIKSLQCEKYLVTYTFNFLNIGCESHSIENWKNFKDDEIKEIGDGALEWWVKWKPIIMQIIEISPSEKYKTKELQDEK